ncbi:MAG: hypothetical protein AAB655_02260 [Patescibacteria group bacterium]
MVTAFYVIFAIALLVGALFFLRQERETDEHRRLLGSLLRGVVELDKGFPLHQFSFRLMDEEWKNVYLDEAKILLRERAAKLEAAANSWDIDPSALDDEVADLCKLVAALRGLHFPIGDITQYFKDKNVPGRMYIK